MTIIQAILNIWTAIVGWFPEAIDGLQVIFWNAETGLTFIGTFTSVGVGIGMGLTVIGLIKRFVKFR